MLLLEQIAHCDSFYEIQRREGINSDHYGDDQREISNHYVGGGEGRELNQYNSNYHDDRHCGEFPTSQYHDGRNH